ncbi:hypothetical protein ANO14919_090340 [Xylariales sp. No.14919]|nr:hypothetical protein F5X98DRAFT_345827 [Xylaria grammica]GAW19546.1 hypothetical protein ANO14919_090340 [Xylariales sp. No.14919]
MDLHLSNQIHVIGFTPLAKFYAHAIASTPNLSVQILAHHPPARANWDVEGRRLRLYSRSGQFISSAEISCPEPIADPALRYRGVPLAKQLNNIIIDTETGAILPTLRNLRHRIDRQTTICLLHSGLGLVDDINEAIFPDPNERPNFVLGESTHRVGRISGYGYSVQYRQSGSLYLYGVPRLENTEFALLGMRQSQHLIQMLATQQSLSVVPLPKARFLWWKIPWLIFSSTADCVSVMLGIKYSQIGPNPYARSLMIDLLEEAITIVSKFPELQVMPHKVESFLRPQFRRKMRAYLNAQGTNTSPWIAKVRMGRAPPIDYFNGYLVRRAEEIGIDAKHHRMAVAMVKARVNARTWELRTDLLGTTPYMTDTDAIGGGRPAPKPEDYEIDWEEM